MTTEEPAPNVDKAGSSTLSYADIRARRRTFREWEENDRAELDELYREAEKETLGPDP